MEEKPENNKKQPKNPPTVQACRGWATCKPALLAVSAKARAMASKTAP